MSSSHLQHHFFPNWTGCKFCSAFKTPVVKIREPPVINWSLCRGSRGVQVAHWWTGAWCSPANRTNYELAYAIKYQTRAKINREQFILSFILCYTYNKLYKMLYWTSISLPQVFSWWHALKRQNKARILLMNSSSSFSFIRKRRRSP